MTIASRKLICSTAIGFAVCATPAVAEAQPASTPPANPQAPARAQASAPSEANQQEIVITAQKRSERLQDVPIAVTALPATELLARNQTKIEDYFSTVPGLNLNSQGNGEMTLAIRGLNTGSQFALTNPAVSMVIDDVPFGSSSVLGFGSRILPDLDPAALARIEVLRGPQGTLYGASSIGGLVKFVTLDPSTSRFSGRVELDANDVADGELGFGARASINAPLSSTLAIRASGFVRRDGGYVDNVATGQNNINRVKAWGGHFAALWRPTEKLSIKLSALGQHTGADGSSIVNADYLLRPTIGDLKQSVLPGIGGYDINVSLYSAAINYDFGGATLTSLTGYGISEFKQTQDVTDTFGFLGDLVFGVNGVSLRNKFKTKKFSQEIRLASPTGSKLEWLLGAFYTNENTPAEQDLFAIDPATGNNAGALLISIFPSKFKEVAGFADATYHFSSKFDVQVGGRYSKNTQDYHETDSGALITAELFAHAKGSAFTYLVTPRYKITPDTMVYLRFASGYRAGGPNPGAVFGFPSQYGPDRTINYEAGLKGSLANHLFNYDLAAYWIDWKHVQIALRDPDTGFSFFANGGSARSRGVEATIQATPAEGLSITANTSIGKAELRQDLPVAAAFGRVGDVLPNSPKFTASLAVDQKFSLSPGIIANVGASLTHMGERRGDFGPTAADIRVRFPAYTTLDLRAGVNVHDWNLTVFARNVTDKRGIIGGGPTSLLGTADTTTPFFVTYIRPRTIGVSLAKTF